MTDSRRRFVYWRFLVALAGACCLPAFSADLSSSWYARVWQTDDGIPGANVTGVAQTKEGYLWIATQSGLARFDGVRIENIPVPVGRERPLIRAMLLDREGRLWLAQDNGVVVRFGSDEPLNLTAEDGLSPVLPLDLVQTADGAVWVSYVDGSVCRISDGRVARFSEKEGLTGSDPCCLATGPRGELWFAKSGRVGMFRDGRFESVLSPGDRAIQVQPAKNDGIWISTSEQLLKYEHGKEAVVLCKIPSDADKVRPTELYEDRTGAVWIGTAADGLFRYDGKSLAKIETSHSNIRTIAEDREGNIWVGTDGGGLNRLRERAVELEGMQAGLPFETVRSVAEDANGGWWVVTQNGAVAHKSGNRWTTVSATDAWPGGQANCVLSDARGVVWFGTYSRGLYRLENGEYFNLRAREGLAGAGVRSMLWDSKGGLWIGLMTGSIVQRWDGSGFQNFAQPPESRAVRAMTEDAAGNIWMGTLEGSLLRSGGDTLVDETPRTFEPYRPIRCLTATPDGSVWIGYAVAGVGRMKDGRFSLIGTEQGLYDGNICSLMTDDHGRMWFGSNRGIFYVDMDELQAVADGKATRLECNVYGRDDGLPSLQAYYGFGPGATRTRDGGLLIPTHSGLAIVHPSRVRMNRVAPPVLIEEVIVDNRPLHMPPRGGNVSLRPNHRRLEIAYAAPSYVAPEQVRFRYQLEGWDDEWQDGGTERVAHYSRLSAGEYHFRVTACNSSGVWNQTGAAFAFVVRPFFWQTWWFVSGSIIAFTLGIVALVRYISFRRMRARLRLLEQETALQRERERIAQDIHDDLGARFTQISLLGELTRRSAQRPEKSGELVAQMGALAQQGIKSLDEIVWAVNPRNDTFADLLDYTGQYALDFLKTAGIRCVLDFPDHVAAQPVAADVRHGLFLVVKEALHNVVKHSRANEVRMRVAITGKTLIWSIADNGRGFETAPDNPLADGLRNMQRRLAALGGECSIVSAPGKGTEVTVVIPLGKLQ